MNTGDRIKQLRLENNLTLEELGERVGVKKAAVHKWESGLTKNLKRTIIQDLSNLFDVSPSYIMGMSNIKNPSNPKKVPLLGTIAAGVPLLAQENIEDYFNIDNRLKCDFALRIQGDSMIGAGIFDGDIVFIKKQSDLNNGDIGAVLIDDSATLKKFFRDNGTIILQAENNDYKPKIYTDGNLLILGKLVAVLNIRD